MPLLLPHLAPWPESPARNGQEIHTTLKLTNVGQEQLSRVAIRVSHPSCFTFKNPLPKSQSASNLSQLLHSSGGEEDYAKTPRATSRTFHYKNPFLSFRAKELKLRKPLKPGKSVDIPCAFRPSQVGNVNYKFLFYYVPQVKRMRIFLCLLTLELLRKRIQRWNIVCKERSHLSLFFLHLM